MSESKNPIEMIETSKNDDIDRVVKVNPRSIENRDIEIDILKIIKQIWYGRFTIIKLTLVFIVFGYFYARFIPNEYTSTVKLLPEIQQTNNLGRLGGLAAQFGFGGATNASALDVLPPQIYPEILISTDFLHGIIGKKIYFEEIQDSITIQQFYNEYQKSNPIIGYTIGLPFKLIGLLRSRPDSVIIITDRSASYKQIPPNEFGAIGGIRRGITLNRDQFTGVLTLSFSTQSPEVSVQLANHVTESLSEYLISYRTEKSRRNLKFLEQRHAEAHLNFVQEQKNLADFRDRNQGNLTASTRTIEQNILSEYNVKLNVYNSLTEQLEQARIKLQEDTPVINIIQNSIYPNFKSSPNRLFIMIILAFLGFVFGVLRVLIKSQTLSFNRT